MATGDRKLMGRAKMMTLEDRLELLRIVKALADGDPIIETCDQSDNHFFICVHCSADAAQPDIILHEDDCLHLQARALVRFL